jgi:hypothetical protein
VLGYDVHPGGGRLVVNVFGYIQDRIEYLQVRQADVPRCTGRLSLMRAYCSFVISIRQTFYHSIVLIV